MHSPVSERWRSHRAQLDVIFVETPPVSRGEFYILAALEMMMATLDEVLAKVAEERTIEQSLSVLLDGYTAERDSLKAQVAELQTELAAAGQDTAKTQAILDALDSNESLLNAARGKITGAVLQPGPDTTTDSDTTSDTVAGGTGDDTVQGSEATDSGTGDANTLDGGLGDDSVTGDDTSTDTLAGGQADDTLTGGSGDDSLQGS